MIDILAAIGLILGLVGFYLAIIYKTKPKAGRDFDERGPYND